MRRTTCIVEHCRVDSAASAIALTAWNARHTPRLSIPFGKHVHIEAAGGRTTSCDSEYPLVPLSTPQALVRLGLPLDLTVSLGTAVDIPHCELYVKIDICDDGGGGGGGGGSDHLGRTPSGAVSGYTSPTKSSVHGKDGANTVQWVR